MQAPIFDGVWLVGWTLPPPAPDPDAVSVVEVIVEAIREAARAARKDGDANSSAV